MLPKPTSRFTIPSIHDDTELECRLYHPSKSDTINRNPRKGAVVAHPYAPLGGCIDDAVIHLVGEAILKQGFVLGLFNFRGAGASKGKTSWSGKHEQADYISFLGFFTIYMHSLSGGISVQSPDPSSVSCPTPSLSPATHGSEAPGLLTLILGGYSYGSLITSQLPDIEVLLSYFSEVTKGSAAAEIRLRASRLAREWRPDVSQSRQRGRTLAVEDALGSPTYGGDECEPGIRRKSRESRRSMDVVRKSVETSRARLHRNRQSSEAVSESRDPDGKLGALNIPPLQICFLLISPVLPPVSSFLTMFSSKHWKPHSQPLTSTTPATEIEERFGSHKTLAVFGNNDFFTSSKKLQKWSGHLAGLPESCFVYKEITGAGHFWQEEGVAEELDGTITAWLKGLEAVERSG